MPQLNIKVVFDCNVIWQSFFFENGVSAKCKKLVDDDIVRLFLSSEVLEEMRDVMMRPELLAKFESVTEKMIESYLEDLAKKATILKSVPNAFTLPRDPDDEDYINLAVESESDFIVTRDNDLLYLMTGIDNTSKEFRQRFRPLKVVEPIEFLRIVEEKLKEDMSINP